MSDMTKAELEAAIARLESVSERYDALMISAPADPPAPTHTSITAAVWRARLTSGRPHFVPQDGETDTHRRALASVDQHLVTGVNTLEPADAAQTRTAIDADQAKIDVVVQQQRNLERSKRVLAERAEAADCSPGEHARRVADVRREAAALRGAEAAAAAVRIEDIDRRHTALAGRIDQYREQVASAVLDDIVRAMPAATAADVLRTERQRAARLGKE